MTLAREQMRYCAMQWRWNRQHLLANDGSRLLHVNRLPQWILRAVWWRESDRKEQKDFL